MVARRVDLQDPATHCARDGTTIVCWDGYDILPHGPAYLRLGGDTPNYVALDDQNVLYADSSLTDEVFEYPLGGLEVVELAPAGEGGACVLDPTGEVTCFGPEQGRFTEPPYERLVGGNHQTVCAQRAADHVLVCNGGQTFDWGPLRHVVVMDLPSMVLLDEGTPNERWDNVPLHYGDPPHVCAITESNAVRCSGWRYDFPDLQAALPAGN